VVVGIFVLLGIYCLCCRGKRTNIEENETDYKLMDKAQKELKEISVKN